MVAEGGMESLDDLVLGQDVEISESDEQLRERMVAAQAQLQKIAKDESKAHGFDLYLAQLIVGLSGVRLKFVIFLINHGIPSLTILALLSLVSDDAGQICMKEFHDDMDVRADFSVFPLESRLQERLSLWWWFIFSADRVSATNRLVDLKEIDGFVQALAHFLSEMLQEFLNTNNVQEFDLSSLQKLLVQYQEMMFGSGELRGGVSNESSGEISE